MSDLALKIGDEGIGATLSYGGVATDRTFELCLADDRPQPGWHDNAHNPSAI